MAIRQEQLVIISRDYYSVADLIARKRLSRSDLLIADIAKKPNNGVIHWERPAAGQDSLPGILVLSSLRDISSYRAKKPEQTRRNMVAVARIGGYATRHIHEMAQSRNRQLSAAALEGIRQSLDTVTNKTKDTFESIADFSSPRDNETLRFLSIIAEVLSPAK